MSLLLLAPLRWIAARPAATVNCPPEADTEDIVDLRASQVEATPNNMNMITGGKGLIHGRAGGAYHARHARRWVSPHTRRAVMLTKDSFAE